MTDVMDDARRIKRGILDFIHTYGCEQAPEEWKCSSSPCPST